MGDNKKTEFELPRGSIAKSKEYVEELFTKEGISKPDESAEILLLHAMGKESLSQLDTSAALSEDQHATYSNYVQQRLTCMPTEHILGECQFKDLQLIVRPPVLVPRPGTVDMVDLMVKHEDQSDDGYFMDVGCGCGPIALYLLKAFPKMKSVALDISSEACDQTKENAEKHDMTDRIEVLEIPINEYPVSANLDKFTFIACNPPLRPSSSISDLPPEFKDFEDIAALDGGDEGTDVMKDTLHVSTKILKHGGSLWMKMLRFQVPLVKRMIETTPVFNQEFDVMGDHPDPFDPVKTIAHYKRR